MDAVNTLEIREKFPLMAHVGCSECKGLGYKIDYRLSRENDIALDLCACAKNLCECNEQEPYFTIQQSRTGANLSPCAIYPLHQKLNKIRQLYLNSGLEYRYKYKFYNTHYESKWVNNYPEFLREINSLFPPMWEGDQANIAQGLFLTGKAGTGKTFLSAILINELIFRHALPALFIKTTRSLDKIRATFNQESAMYGMGNRMENWYGSVPLLVLDDFGAHYSTEWAEETLYDIIDTRYEKGLPIIITSNNSLDELAAIAQGRIASRIYEMCKVVYFPDLDIRVKKSNEEMQ